VGVDSDYRLYTKLREGYHLSHPNKDKQRANRARRRIEEKLDSKNSFGITDKTPQLAIKRIMNSKAVS